MNPYYDIVRLMREQKSGKTQLAEGTVHLEPTYIEVMGERIEARFASHIGADKLYNGASCLVYMGQEEMVVLAVW
ncbi:MAG: hypothetical protein IKU13_01900 [Clostridia bacterium]|nr:hypothetical protein [Clostridia bacterium]